MEVSIKAVKVTVHAEEPTGRGSFDLVLYGHREPLLMEHEPDRSTTSVGKLRGVLLLAPEIERAMREVFESIPPPEEDEVKG